MNEAQRIAERVNLIDLVRACDKLDNVERRVLLEIAEGMVKVKTYYADKGAQIDGEVR